MSTRNGLDLAIRLVAASVLGCIAIPGLVFLCIMGTDSGTQEARDFSTRVLVLGSLAILVLILVSIFGPKIADRTPGPKVIWRIFFRIPPYAIVAGALLWFFWRLLKRFHI
jgi:hypothetical protein